MGEKKNVGKKSRDYVLHSGLSMTFLLKQCNIFMTIFALLASYSHNNVVLATDGYQKNN